LELTKNACLTLWRHYNHYVLKKNAAKAGIEPACFRVEVEYLTNYTIVAKLSTRQFFSAYIVLKHL
jgi:hypothetical protein